MLFFRVMPYPPLFGGDLTKTPPKYPSPVDERPKNALKEPSLQCRIKSHRQLLLLRRHFFWMDVSQLTGEGSCFDRAKGSGMGPRKPTSYSKEPLQSCLQKHSPNEMGFFFVFRLLLFFLSGRDPEINFVQLSTGIDNHNSF